MVSNLPRIYRLPHGCFDAATHARWCALGDTELQVPILEAASVEAMWRELDAAATVWRAVPLEERIEILARALDALRLRGPGVWREALSRSAGLSAAGIDAAWDVTFAPHGIEAVRTALAREGLDAACLAGLEDAGRLPHRIVHVVAGNVLPPVLVTLLRGWLLGAAQWLRPAAREPLFAACLLAELAERVPNVAACTALLWWPHEDPAAMSVFGSADVVTVQGDDASVESLRAHVAALPHPPRFVGYGARWSGAVVSRAAQTPATAAALAQDVALFDQQGCLSPTIVFAEHGARLDEWCARLAGALADCEARMPRGAIDPVARAALRHWHEDVRVELALGEVEAIWEEATRWGVIRLARCGFHDTPLDRHVVVVPFAESGEIADALGVRLAKLQGLGVALDGWEESERLRLLAELRPTRVAAVGTLQSAPLAWAQDHHPPFASLLAPAPAAPAH
ncbi:MAG TPA: acyl-CoA reductase [Candidatus Krumholzibacteria bacterium]|nr:acyl-CoA reductase [Candidatus Krumholzibacteria bacterium]